MDSPLRFLPLLKQFVNKISAFIWAVTFLLIPPIQLVAETFVPVGVGGIVTIIPVAPVAAEDNFSMDEDTTAVLDVLLNDSEQRKSQFNKLCTTQPYQHCFSISQVFPSQSSVAVEGNKLAVTPPKDWHGNAYFHYRLYDGKSRASKQAKVIVKVNPVNDAPIAKKDHIELVVGTPGCDKQGVCSIEYDVLSNDVDIDGDQLALKPITGGVFTTSLGGKVSINNNKLVYTPSYTRFFNGDVSTKTPKDAFTYTAIDGKGGQHSAAAIFYANIKNTKAPQIISSLTEIKDKVGEKLIPVVLLIKDEDTPIASVNVQVTSSNSALLPLSGISKQVIYAEGHESQIQYHLTPRQGVSGVSVLSFTATDVHKREYTHNIRVNISPGKPPVISHIADQLVKRNGNLQLAFTVSDADTSSDKLVVSASSSNTSVLAAAVPVTGGNGQYQLNLKPLPNVEGETIVTVKASDNPQGINVSTFQFKVKVAASPVIKQRFDWSAASVGVGQAVTLNYHFTEVVSCTDEKGASVKELPSYPELKGSRLMTFYQQSGSAQLVLSWRCKNQAGREFEFSSAPLTVNKLKASTDFQIKQ